MAFHSGSGDFICYVSNVIELGSLVFKNGTPVGVYCYRGECGSSWRRRARGLRRHADLTIAGTGAGQTIPIPRYCASEFLVGMLGGFIQPNSRILFSNSPAGFRSV